MYIYNMSYNTTVINTVMNNIVFTIRNMFIPCSLTLCQVFLCLLNIIFFRASSVLDQRIRLLQIRMLNW